MNTDSDSLRIAITMGDASGIGPEVVVRSLLDESIYKSCKPFVIGDKKILKNALKMVNGQAILNVIKTPNEASGNYGSIDVLDLHNLNEQDVLTGKVCAACGKASVEYIFKAAEFALRKEVDAIVTAPINKESTRKAGYGELGHLELLANYSGVSEYATMLISGLLRVVHLTTHYSLKEALNHVTRDCIYRRLKLTADSLESWGIKHPRIAVAALNPHGGEGGILGKEEIEQIIPAVSSIQAAGIHVFGPYPADTVFWRAIKGEFDAVLAMYHDQGHIPIKIYGFEKSVSVALGLPFIRTSVDHGTAFDIAWKGIADAQSMQEAIKVAVRLNRKNSL
jgi:4-hydroxythreonine-4-phosphate dehydrogenase